MRADGGVEADDGIKKIEPSFKKLWQIASAAWGLVEVTGCTWRGTWAHYDAGAAAVGSAQVMAAREGTRSGGRAVADREVHDVGEIRSRVYCGASGRRGGGENATAGVYGLDGHSHRRQKANGRRRDSR